MEFFLTIRADKILLATAARLIDLGQRILEKETEVAANLQDIVNAVASEATAIAGLQTFITGLQNQIAGLGIPPAQQAQIDGIFSSVNQNAAAIAAAMAIGVPAGPAPTVVPPVT